MKHYSLNSYRDYKCIVVANGEFPRHRRALDIVDQWLRDPENYTLACCDGAVNNLLSYCNTLPNKVVGDLDSIAPDLKARLGKHLVHVAEQDSNDLSKTIKHLSQQGYKNIILLAATGKREDHTLANLALLPCYADLLEDLVLVSDYGYFRLIKEPSTLEVEIGTQISFFNFEQSPLSVQGVHWGLDQITLPYLWSGTLNRCDEPIVKIKPSNPILVYIAFA